MSIERDGFPREVLTLDDGVTSYLSADEVRQLALEAVPPLCAQTTTPVGTPKTPVGTPVSTPVGTPKTPVGTPVGTPKTPVGTPKTPVGTPKTVSTPKSSR